MSTDIKASLKERLQAVSEMFPEAKKYASGQVKVVQGKVFNDSKVTDHYALIPTEQRPNYAKFSSDEHRIYGLIVARFLGLFAPAHKVEQKRIVVKFGQAQFNFKEDNVVEAGWKRSENTQKELAKWQVG